jgi:hypothetical protein
VSEQNILNPTATSLFNFDYGYTEGLPELRSVFQAQSGNIYSRLQQGLGRVYDLGWNNRDLTTKLALQQWENQYRDDYFSLADWDEARYFTGRFDGPLSYSPSGNQKYNIRGRFIELPGKPMFAYPTNWNRDAVFMEERNSAGEDLVKLLTPGNWTFDTSGVSHNAGRYFTGTTNETAEWVYFGYGFRFWSDKESVLGIVELTVTRVRDGAVVVPAQNIDLYNAVDVSSAPLFTSNAIMQDRLDLYRVKLRCTGTKNGASTNFVVIADAIQVMR